MTELFKPNKKQPAHFTPTTKEGQPNIRQGTEALVSEATVLYPKNIIERKEPTKREQPIDGFVIKRYGNIGGVFEKLRLEVLILNWGILKKISSDLRKLKLPGFNLPNTVRVIKDEKGTGVLMTDLSEGGKNAIIDLKNLAAREHYLIYPQDWEQIKNDVLRDIDIAIENNINLESGPSGLDAWLLVLDRKTEKYKPYIVDIGHVAFYKEKSAENTRDLLAAKARVVEDLRIIGLSIGTEKRR